MGATDSSSAPSVVDKHQLPSHTHAQHPVRDIPFGYRLVCNGDLALPVPGSSGLVRVVARHLAMEAIRDLK